MSKEEEMLSEVVSNITRIPREKVNVSQGASFLHIIINMAEIQPVYFCKKINEHVVKSIRGAYTLYFIEYRHEDETLYSFARSKEGKVSEGFKFEER